MQKETGNIVFHWVNMDINEITIIKNNPLEEELITLLNDVQSVIDDFCIKHKVDDLSKESTNLFNALLLDINAQLIKPNKDLLLLPNKANNKYNPDALFIILELYERLCLIYDNAITIYGFGLLTGMDRQSVYNLANDDGSILQVNNITKTGYKPRKSGFDIFQKLKESEEQTTLNCRKYNDLRIIARLNRITNGAYRDYTQVDNAITRKTLTSEEVAEKYGRIESGENTAFLTDNNNE